MQTSCTGTTEPARCTMCNTHVYRCTAVCHTKCMGCCWPKKNGDCIFTSQYICMIESMCGIICHSGPSEPWVSTYNKPQWSPIFPNDMIRPMSSNFCFEPQEKQAKIASKDQETRSIHRSHCWIPAENCGWTWLKRWWQMMTTTPTWLYLTKVSIGVCRCSFCCKKEAKDGKSCPELPDLGMKIIGPGKCGRFSHGGVVIGPN